MIVCDEASCLEVSGSGEVLEPSDGVHGALWRFEKQNKKHYVPGETVMYLAAVKACPQRCHLFSTPLSPLSAPLAMAPSHRLGVALCHRRGARAD